MQPHDTDSLRPPAPALITRRRPEPARAAVLFLHGGRAESDQLSRPWHLAAMRMHPFLRAVSAALPGQDVLLARARYRHRGWNGSRADPVYDARHALRELTELIGPVPTVLVGHSMGARAALRIAGPPHVRAVLALAPWCPPQEPVQQLAGCRVVVLHGERDRVTNPADSTAYVRRARALTQAGMAVIRDGDHAMLRRHRMWHRTAAAMVAHLLDPASDADPLPARAYIGNYPPVL